MKKYIFINKVKKIKNRNIILIGPTGSGKSTIGMQLSKKLNKEFFDSDLEIEKRFGSINSIFQNEGEKEFRKKEEQIIEKLISKKGIVLSTGGGCIHSVKTRNLLYNNGFIICLQTTIEKQLIRINRDKKRPLLIGDSIRKILEELSLHRNPLYKKISDLIYFTDEYSINKVVKEIFNFIQRHK